MPCTESYLRLTLSLKISLFQERLSVEIRLIFMVTDRLRQHTVVMCFVILLTLTTMPSIMLIIVIIAFYLFNSNYSSKNENRITIHVAAKTLSVVLRSSPIPLSVSTKTEMFSMRLQGRYTANLVRNSKLGQSSRDLEK